MDADSNKWCDGYPNLQTFDYVATSIVQWISQRAFVQTDSPPAGYYWWIPYLNVIDTDINDQALDLYLLDQSATGKYPSGIAFPTIACGNIPGFHKINAIDGNSSNSTYANFTSQAGRAANTFAYKPIVVPPLWSLLALEINGVTSANGRTIAFRMARMVIPLGVRPPWM